MKPSPEEERALRQDVARCELWMKAATAEQFEQVSKQIGVRLPVLKAALRGEPLGERDLERVERWLRPPIEPTAGDPEEDRIQIDD